MEGSSRNYVCSQCGQVTAAFAALKNRGVCPSCGVDLPEMPFAAKYQADSGMDAMQFLAENNLEVSRGEGRTGVSPPLTFARDALDDSGALPDSGEEMVALQIVPVKGVLREKEVVSQLFNTLASAAGPLIFEFAGTHLQRYIIVRCHRKHMNTVRGQLTGLYRSPEIIELPPSSDPGQSLSAGYECRAQARLLLRYPAALPIRTYREMIHNDSILNLLASLYGLQESEAGIMQILLHGPAPSGWAAKYRAELLQLRRRRVNQISLPDLLRLAALLGGLLMGCTYCALGGWLQFSWLLLLAATLTAFGLGLFFKQSDLAWSEAMEEMVARKIEQPGYRVEIRLAVVAAREGRARQLLKTMIDSFRVFAIESGNTFLPAQRPAPFQIDSFAPSRGSEIILGDCELAALWHLPLDEVPDMLAVKKYDHTLTDPERFRPQAGEAGWLIGYSQKDAGPRIPIRLPLATISSKHAILLGQSGTGKTTVLEHMIRAVLAQERRSLVVIDPHGDMGDRLIGLIPEDRIEDVIVLDLGDETTLPVLNLLDVNLYGGSPEKTVSAFKEVAHALYGKFWGPRMEVPFERTMMALALANTQRPARTQFTIADAYYFLLMNKDVRIDFLKTNLPSKHILSDVVIKYFQLEYDVLENYFKQQVVSPVLSKLNPFLSQRSLLCLFGQPESTLNPLVDVRSGKILIVKTAMAEDSVELSNFVGSVILNMTKRAILAQRDLPEEERTRVTIVVDESQEFPGFDFGFTLAKLRKFGGNIFLTSQGEAFLGEAVASDHMERPKAFKQVMANVSTRIVFRLAGHDARVITETEFVGQMEPENLVNLEEHTAFLQFDAHKKVHGPLLIRTLPPLEVDPGVRARILSARAKYSLRIEEAVANARRVLTRLHVFYGSRQAGEEAMLDGEMTLVAHSHNSPLKNVSTQFTKSPTNPHALDKLPQEESQIEKIKRYADQFDFGELTQAVVTQEKRDE
jgi:hypothetical protein